MRRFGRGRGAVWWGCRAPGGRDTCYRPATGVMRSGLGAGVGSLELVEWDRDIIGVKGAGGYGLLLGYYWLLLREV